MSDQHRAAGSSAARSHELAAWLRRMDVADQIFLTGTVLVLQQIRERRSLLPVPFDERLLCTTATPEEAARYAAALSEAYRGQPPFAAPDGVDEHWRISSMTGAFAARIRFAYPGLDLDTGPVRGNGYGYGLG